MRGTRGQDLVGAFAHKKKDADDLITSSTATAAAAYMYTYIKRKFRTGECRRTRDVVRFFPTVHKGAVVARAKSQKADQN